MDRGRAARRRALVVRGLYPCQHEVFVKQRDVDVPFVEKENLARRLFCVHGTRAEDVRPNAADSSGR